MKSIGNYAFQRCESVSSLLLPESIQSLGNFAFSYLLKLTSVFLPKNVQSLGGSLFYSSSSLEIVEFDSEIQLTYISSWLLRLTQVKSFKVPKNIKTLSSAAFEHDYSLETIEVDPENTEFISDNGILYKKDFSTLLFFPANHSKDYIIRNECQAIGDTAFSNAIIENVTIPNGVMSIGQYAFQYTHITSITLPPGITNIPLYTFRHCSSLFQINMSDEVTELSSYAFSSCNFTVFVIPEKVTSIGSFCFQNNENLVNVTLSNVLKHLGGGIFNNCNDNLVISFPQNSSFTIINNSLIVDNQTESIYQYLGDNETVFIPKTIKTIKTGAFYNCITLSSVILEKGSILSTIDTEAFSGCAQLESFPFNSVSEFGISSFYGCNSLTSITFGPQLNSIGSTCFCGCRNLESVTFLNSSHEIIIDSQAFASLEKLSSVIFSNSVSSISASAFQDCIGIKEINFSASIVFLGESCFQNTGLTKVTFDENCELTNIPSSAFKSCKYLIEINLHQHIENISTLSFAETKISSFTVPLATKSIGQQAFDSCAYLEHFIIPEDCALVDIGYKIFSGCTRLSSIKSNVHTFVVENEALYSEKRDILYAFPPNSIIRFFAFSENVKTVSPGAFYGCKNLEIVLIPDSSIETIGFNAFEQCTNLHTINFPESITKIEQNAFLGCNKLKCGLSIQETNEKIINEWISSAALPERCTKPCFNPTCHQKQYFSSNFRYTIIVLYLSK